MICAVLPYMRAQNAGKIISIGSVAARIPHSLQSMYSASKAALASMTGALRLELKGTGVSLASWNRGIQPPASPPPESLPQEPRGTFPAIRRPANTP